MENQVPNEVQAENQQVVEEQVNIPVIKVDDNLIFTLAYVPVIVRNGRDCPLNERLDARAAQDVLMEALKGEAKANAKQKKDAKIKAAGRIDTYFVLMEKPEGMQFVNPQVPEEVKQEEQADAGSSE